MSSNEEIAWSPRQSCAGGTGQTPLAIGSWDFYFCSDQSMETDWKLKVTTDQNAYTQIKVRSASCHVY